MNGISEYKSEREAAAMFAALHAPNKRYSPLTDIRAAGEFAVT